MSYVALLLFVVTGSSGLLFASSNSLPGDLLYPLKVNVSEPLQSVATIGTTAKINWEAQKVQNRLEEVEVLAVSGRLDANLSQEIESRLNAQTEAFDKAVQDAESKISDTQSIKADLDSKIDTHNRILEKIENHSSSVQKNQIAQFRNKTLKSVKSFSKQIPKSNALSTTTFDQQEKKLESLIKNTESNFNKKTKNIKATSTLEGEIIFSSQDDISSAKESLKEARRKRDSGNIGEAGQDLQNSQRKVESADIYIEQGSKLSGDSNSRD